VRHCSVGFFVGAGCLLFNPGKSVYHGEITADFRDGKNLNNGIKISNG